MKMSWQLWAIIILLVTSFYQYYNPAKANELLDPIWSPVKDFIKNKNPLQNLTVTCPTTDEPVCGNDGVTYKNSCEAALKDVTQITPGVC